MTPGTVIDRYRILEVLGEGGMASVYLARHEILGSRHAIKVLRPEFAVYPPIRDRFLAEGRIAAQIRHPNIVDVTDVVVDTGVAGLVMEYVEGATLDLVLEVKEAPMGAAACRALFLPILDGVGEAHAYGVVHRDLKPGNIVITHDRRGGLRPVVLDFGIAKLEQDTRVEHRSRVPTNAGTRMGTPAYMSPEQVRETASVDVRTDVFALGAILYECATGHVAFTGDSDFDVMQAIVKGRYADPAEANPAIEPDLAAIIRTALALDPDDRFPTCASFAAALTSLPAPHRRPSAPSVATTAGPTATAPAPPSWRGATLRIGDVRVALTHAENTVGTDPGCDIVLTDPTVSGTHCTIARAGRRWSIEDHRSTLGTLVDGTLTVGRQLLRGGERIVVGRTTLVFEAGDG